MPDPHDLIRLAFAAVLALCLVAPAAAQTTKPAGPVRLGIDHLRDGGYAPLKGKRVAIVTNNTGLDSQGTHLVTLLAGADGVNVVKLFSPEHGLYGVEDTKVGDTVEPKTGLPVLSLYGQTRRPSDEMLAGVDAIIFDIQDVGARYYTYIATMGYCMEAAAKNGITVVVLDRPNPISGLRVEGPIADEAHQGFTAYGPLPVAHGMTVGELATMFNTEYDIDCDLVVVPMTGWERSMYWDETGVKWVNPSPNMRSPTQALLYIAVGLLEATNVGVGRGTDAPFERFGAPFIDGEQLAKELNDANLPGLKFTPVTFTPDDKYHVHHGKVCHGVDIAVTDRDAYEGVVSGATFAWTLNRLYPDYKYDNFDNLLQKPGRRRRDQGDGRPPRVAEAVGRRPRRVQGEAGEVPDVRVTTSGGRRRSSPSPSRGGTDAQRQGEGERAAGFRSRAARLRGVHRRSPSPWRGTACPSPGGGGGKRGGRGQRVQERPHRGDRRVGPRLEEVVVVGVVDDLRHRTGGDRHQPLVHRRTG